MEKNTGYPSVDRKYEKENGFLKNHPIIPSMSVYNALGLISSFYRDAIAVDCLDLRITYQELLDTSKILSRAFKELGIKSNDIITASMPNFFQAIAVYLAANRIGAVTTFINPGCSIEETKYYLNEFESPLFINYDKGLEYNFNIKKDTKVRQVITLNHNDINIKKFNDVKVGDIGYSDFISFNDMKLIADYYKQYINTNYGGKQDSMILFTSGSSGNPKSVVLTNENILASGIYMKNTGNVKTSIGERCLVCVPFSYPYGFVSSTLASLLTGREAVLAPNIGKENIEYFLSKNPNMVFGSPALLELIRKNVSDTQDLSSIHSFISGGDFLSQAQAEEGKKFFQEHNANVEIYNGSGNAESVGASTMPLGVEVKPETVGRVLLGSQAIVVDPDTMEELKYGEEGMLCVAGKHVFKEYYKNPELTEQAKFMYKGKEYLKSGTMGRLAEDGYFTLTGRTSRFFIRADLNKVYCEHVQQVVNNIDGVEACVVVPKPDDDLLYVSKVYIVLKDGVTASTELIDYIIEKCNHPVINKQTGERMELKSFEIPQSISFIKNIPRTPSADKINYRKLEEMAKEEYELEKNQTLNKKL